MKSTSDAIYKKFTKIVFDWCERRNSQYGVALSHIVRESYSDEDYYALKIGCSNFAEESNYDRTKDEELDEHDKSIIKLMCCSERLSLDELSELNVELKAAGAKTVYIHPYRWVDSNGFSHESCTNQQLLLIEV